MTPSPSSPNPSASQWQFWLTLLTMLGVPTAGFTLASQITHNYWVASGVALLCELGVIITRFTSRTWIKLEEKWVTRAADWLDTKLQNTFSGYRQKYSEYLHYQHRTFDVKGLATQGTFTLELGQVFVELRVAPRPPHHASADPLQPPAELRETPHVLWDFLGSKTWQGHHLVIIGSPGSGKTTLLKHAALTLVAKGGSARRLNGQHKLPILLFLRDYVAAIKNDPKFSLIQAIHDSLERHDFPKPPPGWFERHLAKGLCLIMLDGLDEVADAVTRQRVAEWVETRMKSHANNRFITTSRPFGYLSNPLSNVTVLQVNPFTSDQIQHFVHNWYLANEIMSSQADDPGVRLSAKQGAQDLLERLRKMPTLSELAVNPLLLTMIANVHRYRSSLPGRRVELYAEICDVFLGKRHMARGLSLDLTPAQKQGVLQPLAHHMMSTEKREIPLAEALAVIKEPLARVNAQANGAEFLKMIEHSSGLLIEREAGVYGFSHLTFQEYLAAMHILEKGLISELETHVEQSWWHETIRLYCARADASPIVAACLRQAQPTVLALSLAFECRTEGRELAPELQKRLESLEKDGVEHNDPTVRRIVTETMLSRRLNGRGMIRLNEDKYVDSTPITHAEYQLFIEEQRAVGHHEPDHWATERFTPGQGQQPVVGVRPTDVVAFCNWLNGRADFDWRYRPPTTAEIKEADGSGAPRSGAGSISCWAQEGNTWVCIPSEALISPEAVRALVEKDLGQAVALTRSSPRTFARDLALALDIELDTPCALALNFTPPVKRPYLFLYDFTRPLTRVSPFRRHV